MSSKKIKKISYILKNISKNIGCSQVQTAVPQDTLLVRDKNRLKQVLPLFMTIHSFIQNHNHITYVSSSPL